MKIKFLLILTIVLIMGFSSCKTDDIEVLGPVITLTTPTDQKDFEIGDTIFIHGDITDNEGLHELMVMVYQEESGNTILDYTPTVHDMASFHIDTFVLPTDTVNVHYHLKIEAWDHDNNADSLNYTLHWAD